MWGLRGLRGRLRGRLHRLELRRLALVQQLALPIGELLALVVSVSEVWRLRKPLLLLLLLLVLLVVVRVTLLVLLVLVVLRVVIVVAKHLLLRGLLRVLGGRLLPLLWLHKSDLSLSLGVFL